MKGLIWQILSKTFPTRNFDKLFKIFFFLSSKFVAHSFLQKFHSKQTWKQSNYNNFLFIHNSFSSLHLLSSSFLLWKQLLELKTKKNIPLKVFKKDLSGGGKLFSLSCLHWNWIKKGYKMQIRLFFCVTG